MVLLACARRVRSSWSVRLALPQRTRAKRGATLLPCLVSGILSALVVLAGCGSAGVADFPVAHPHTAWYSVPCGSDSHHAVRAAPRVDGGATARRPAADIAGWVWTEWGHPRRGGERQRVGLRLRSRVRDDPIRCRHLGDARPWGKLGLHRRYHGLHRQSSRGDRLPDRGGCHRSRHGGGAGGLQSRSARLPWLQRGRALPHDGHGPALGVAHAAGHPRVYWPAGMRSLECASCPPTSRRPMVCSLLLSLI